MEVKHRQINPENIVASAQVGQELDLDAVAMDIETGHIKYNPEDFPGIVWRFTDPKCVALLFRSGEVVFTGATDRSHVESTAKNLFDKLASLNISVDEPDITIVNVVCSSDLGESVNLNAAAIGMGLESVEYEPEQFPGLVYRLEEPDVVVLIFGSGKVVITGGTSIDEARSGLEQTITELNELGLLS